MGGFGDIIVKKMINEILERWRDGMLFSTDCKNFSKYDHYVRRI